MTPEETQKAPVANKLEFRDRDQAIAGLCMKVFGAYPNYEEDQPPAPEPIEVDVWVHEDGSVSTSDLIPQNRPQDYGWALRRATIHPETK